MDHGATAPAMPVANRKVVRASWRTGLCVIVLHWAVTPVLAESDPAQISNSADALAISPLQTARLETDPDSLKFTQKHEDAAVSVAKAVIQANLVGTPRTKPTTGHKSLSRQALAATVSAGSNGTIAQSKLFGTPGEPVSLSPVTKRWQRALENLELDADVSGKDRNSFRAYSAIVNQVRPHRRGLQIPKINYMVNRLLAYREDSVLYKSGEFWASPVETLSRRAGDCEDYAILKYALLRDLGVKDNDMRIVVLRDTAARQYHAVLSVRHKGQWLILDNRFSRVRFERDLPHYQALYSVNAAGEWAHAPRAGSPVRLAARLKSATR